MEDSGKDDIVFFKLITKPDNTKKNVTPIAPNLTFGNQFITGRK